MCLLIGTVSQMSDVAHGPFVCLRNVSISVDLIVIFKPLIIYRHGLTIWEKQRNPLSQIPRMKTSQA